LKWRCQAPLLFHAVFFEELHEMEALKEKVTMSELAGNSHQSDPVKRARLRWRARRGLLENDLILTRFLDINEESLSDEEVDAFSRLMELSDSVLMDLIMAKKEPEAEVDLPHVHALLSRLRIA
jgi:antitoxin CptB